jgi:hypothetical protein
MITIRATPDKHGLYAYTVDLPGHSVAATGATLDDAWRRALAVVQQARTVA